MLELNTIHLGDCLDLMGEIPDGSVDMILCDLPYGLTQNKWDAKIPFDLLWLQYERLVKGNGAIVLFGDSMFGAKLMLSNEKLYRYELVWDKVAPSGFLNANKMPMRRHENIFLFYKKLPTYNKQLQKRSPNTHSLGKVENYTKSKGREEKSNYGVVKDKCKSEVKDFSLKNPDSILKFTKGNGMGKYKRFHPTQKPVALFSYLIKTYSNKGDIILDNCIGSGTTAISALETGRQFIGIEKDPEYHRVATERVGKYKKEYKQGQLL